ncbi:MAG: cation:proton antiporter [Chromatiaceae bacterium]|nr:cation:proton antiporter [Gammaproteobacteria bacterium]MCP5306358.1 cation:proton antiporter [Chromatiaceae bacterium]MCP5311910.1 cation:proton antiporter [Chromatiaceae bacterium]
MGTAGWFLLVGGLLLVMGMSAPLLRRIPVTSSIVYLVVGLFAGPTVLALFHFNPLQESRLLEILTEVAVLVSLFSAGVKMPVPVSLARWRAPIMLAFVSMAVSVGAVALFGHFLLGLPLGGAILLGAILAPTDPVLATDVQVRHPGDRDRLRFTLTCEAGMNDGSAFPFVMLGLGLLGLHELGEFGGRWLLIDVFWATAAGLVIGVVCGVALGRLAAWIRRTRPGHGFLDDFLGLGLIGIVYGISLVLSAWGFLAVFFAAVALRQTELRIARRAADANEPSGEGGQATVEDAAGRCLPVSEASLIFKEHIERLSELVLILSIGGMLFVDSWSWRAVATAAFVFLVARPASVLIGLAGTRTTWRIRGMAAWFGVRGIGSLYYLMYAIEHGLSEALAVELIHITLVVVTLSILAHGISVKPMMRQYRRQS